MPKEKIQLRTPARRAASKEALKQMQTILRGSETRYEISSDDDVIEVEVQPPKKKYKLSHKKSSDGQDRDVIVLRTVEDSVFDLEVVVEDLASCQKTRRDHLKKESKEVDAKIEQLIAASKAEVIYNGVFTTAIEIKDQIQQILNSAATSTHSYQSQAPSSVQQSVPGQSIVLQPPNSTPQSYQLVMDPMGVIVGAVPTSNSTPNTPPLQLYQQKVTNSEPMKTRRTALRQTGPASVQKTPVKPGPPPKKTLTVKQNLLKKSPAPSIGTKPIIPVNKAIIPTKKTITPTPAAPFRPTETNVEGGLSMGRPQRGTDLTSEDGRALPDSREVSFNKLQGRTYPSLVVVARPHLRVKDLAADRAKLDVKVKSVLMYPPTKFTEWLIQQGLVRSDQKCSVHASNALKLGMYSDASKFPYSGGYVWISECCPQRFVSVFSGSLFEGSQHPPMALLKLLYHWCCQTIVQNVTQWVKVDNLYVKGMYTWLRSACTVALHTHIKQLGGPGVKVQVGVISLGTTSQDGNKREVKVEVLGILETTTRHIRLRAVEPLADGERNFKKRFNKILEPVFNWVHPASVIVTDLTVDKATLHQMGFLHVTQSTSTDYNNSNRTIMEYLRRIVPRMFQNTLSLLSRQIIQQFLDELVWREWYGTTVLQCFDNMLLHLSEQTRYDSGQSLVVRLNKVSSNPFKNWAVPAAGSVPPTPVAPVKAAEGPGPKRYGRQRKPASSPPVQDIVRPAKSTSPDVPEQMVPLENYYYGTINTLQKQQSRNTLDMKCPFCRLSFNTNISLMNHLFKHAHNVSNDVQLCKYCLTIVPTGNDLLKHIAGSHPDETKFDNSFVCLICESHFRNPFILGKHMSKEHCPSELPYLCGTCGFRCSNHKQAVDHFYQSHDHGTTIQCPFCLKSTSIHSGGRNLTQNMNYFIQHLQKHQKKTFAKRCGRCVLWFIQKEFLKDHQIKMHVSQRGKQGLVPSFAPRNGVMVPKSKMDKCPDDAKVINFTALYFNVAKTLNCKECDKPLGSPKHFASFDSCQNTNCQYSTCCSSAMQDHVLTCKNLHENIPQEKLPFEMFCVCGYRDIYGNSMARHLAICERKSAYPSKEAAQGATTTQCMLDVLGLVRKPEETKKTEGSLPIILKRGKAKKAASPSAVIELNDDIKDEECEVQINISDVRGGVDIKEEDKEIVQVDLTEKEKDAEKEEGEGEETEKVSEVEESEVSSNTKENGQTEEIKEKEVTENVNDVEEMEVVNENGEVEETKEIEDVEETKENEDVEETKENEEVDSTREEEEDSAREKEDEEMRDEENRQEEKDVCSDKAVSDTAAVELDADDRIESEGDDTQKENEERHQDEPEENNAIDVNESREDKEDSLDRLSSEDDSKPKEDSLATGEEIKEAVPSEFSNEVDELENRIKEITSNEDEVEERCTLSNAGRIEPTIEEELLATLEAADGSEKQNDTFPSEELDDAQDSSVNEIASLIESLEDTSSEHDQTVIETPDFEKTDVFKSIEIDSCKNTEVNDLAIDNNLESEDPTQVCPMDTD